MNTEQTSFTKVLLENVRFCKKLFPMSDKLRLSQLKTISELTGLSLRKGELCLLDGGWFITHVGLLTVAKQKGCAGIATELLQTPSAKFGTDRWIFRATVFTSDKCKGFVGFGDAEPANVSPKMRGAEMRVAETRAVNRALRKAYGIGICSLEELGSFSGPSPSSAPLKKPVTNRNGHPLRDRLCLLVRQHQLDPALVKLYGADFCGTQELRQARRELVKDFIQHLAHYAAHDREGLLCHLNSFAPKPVTPAGTNSSGDGPKAAGGAA